MVSRRDALKSAIRQRRCPPCSIKQMAQWEKQYKDHCRICPFCEIDPKDDLKDDLDAWNVFEEHFLKAFPDHFSSGDQELSNIPETLKKTGKESEVKPGEIRILKTNDNPWDKGFYYSPPAVMVLKQKSASEQYIPVAQIFSEPALAGPGDLVIEDLTTGSLCIETWNIFHVKMESLGRILDQKDRHIVDAVVAMHKDPDYSPDFAPLLVPIKPDGPRALFRQYEQETAQFFNENKILPPVFHFMDRTTLMADLKNKAPGIHWKDAPDNLWDIFAGAVLPDDYYPMAAAAEDFMYYYAILYIYEKGKISEVRAVRAEAECVRTKVGIAYSIFLPELPVPWEGVYGYSHLKLRSGEIILPVEVKVAMEYRSLSAAFEVDDCLTGILKTALFCQRT